MKVLKEKKASLLFWRGLVILSIIALAFAACGDTKTRETPGETITLPPQLIPVDGPFVMNVTLLNRETFQSRVAWQGLPIDLTGAVIDVTWNEPVMDGNGQARTQRREVITLGPTNIAGWGTDPIAPDWAGVWGGVPVDTQEFRIVHRSNAQAQSSAFVVAEVIPLVSLTAELPANFMWFSDRRPERVEELTLTGRWQYEVYASNHATVASRGEIVTPHALSITDVNQAINVATATTDAVLRDRSQRIPFSDGYPRLDFTNVIGNPGNTRPFLEVQIGSFHPASGTDNNFVYRAQLPILRFLQPEGIEFRPIAEQKDTFFFRDDQFVAVADGNLDLALLRFAQANNPLFTVWYLDGAERISRYIDFVEFEANREYFRIQTGGAGVAQLTDFERANETIAGRGPRRPSIRQPGVLGILDNQAPDGQAPYWTFTVDYVGPLFGDATNRVRATAEVPLYRFVNFGTPAVQRQGVLTNLMIHQWARTDNPPRPASISDVSGLLEGINARWLLQGNYARTGGTPPTKLLPMDFVPDMFEIVPDPLITTNDYFPAWPLDLWGDRAVTRYPLVVGWRGSTTARGEDTTVVIEVRGREDPPANRYIHNVSMRLPPISGTALNVASFTDLRSNGTTPAMFGVTSATIASVGDASVLTIVLQASPTSGFTYRTLRASTATSANDVTNTVIGLTMAPNGGTLVPARRITGNSTPGDLGQGTLTFIATVTSFAP